MSGAPGEGFQPWLGLLPYSEADQELFFGRESDTLDLLRLVRREVLTVLFGRSGTGKSSLLKAGLFPKMRQEQFLPIWIRLDHSGRTTYGRQIRAEIESSLASHDIEVEILNAPLADESDDFWEYLHRIVFWDAKNQPVTPVLVFDQFEEMFTLGRNRPEVGGFFEELAAVAENLIPKRIRDGVISGGAKLPNAYNDRHYKLMISLREDYVSRLDTLARDMPSVMHNRHALTHMTGEQALEVVLKPGGDLVEETVARKIVRFVAAANDVEAVVAPKGETSQVDLQNLRTEPALLSLVCSELNLQRIKEGRTSITLEQVQRSSDQILEDFYERSLEGLDSSDRRFIEDRLVTASGFRTTVPVEEAVSAGLVDEEVEELVSRRLLRKEDRLGTPHIELTHDVLTRVVTRSRNLRQQREDAEAQRVEKEKEESERKKLRQRQEIESLRTRRMRNTMRGIWGIIALSTVLATVAVILFFSGREVDKARQLASARNLALKGIDVLHQDPELSLLLSIESALAAFPDTKTAQGAPEDIEMALRTATRESLIRRRYEGHTSKVYSVDFDHEGRRLLTSAAAPDGTARIWDVDTAKEIAQLDPGLLPGGSATISCARFSPDGRRIVTTTYRNDGAVYIWDAESLRSRQGGVPQVVIEPQVTFTGHRTKVTSAAFSPDGKMVASGGHDNLVRLWDPATGKELAPPLGSRGIHHTKRVRSVAFNADGEKLLSTSDDGTAILWDLGAAMVAGISPTPSGLEKHKVFIGNKKETLHDGELSPSGNLVATVGNDKALRVWDATTGAQLAAQTQPDGVMDVAFIDDERLVTVCNDSAVRFWTLGNAAEEPIGSFHPEAESVKVLRLLGTQKGHKGWIRDVAVSPDKRFIATCADDRFACLWKLPPGGETVVFGEPEFFSWSADVYFTKATATSRERLTAFSGTKKGDVRAVDAFRERALEDWGPLAEDEKIRHKGEVRSISVSPDGRELVTASSDQTVIVWDAVTGRPKFQITGHQGPFGGTVYQARHSADGKRIVTASNEGSVRVWNAGTGAQELLLFQDRQTIGKAGFEDFSGLVAKLKAPGDPVSSYVAAQFTAGELALLANPDTENKVVDQTVLGVLDRLIRDGSLKDEPIFNNIGKRPLTLDLAKRNLGDTERRILNRLILEDAFPDEISRNRFYDARFSRDGSQIVTADFDTQTATVWDARDGRRIRAFPRQTDSKQGHGDNVVSASFSPDGKRVVTACVDGFCRIWEVGTGALLKSIPHNIAVRSAEYSPDGGLILTAAADGVARLWTSPDCKPRTELRGHTETLADARFSNDGSYIITASRDGTARVYVTHPWWIYDLATERVTRKLTKDERKRYDVTRELTKEEEAYYETEKTAAP